MKKINSIILILCLQNLIFAQNCTPSDNCTQAPFLNLENYITTKSGYSPSSNPPLECSDPSNPFSLGNDLWIRFTPLVFNFYFIIESLGNTNSAFNNQALIYEDCNSLSIDCTPECSDSLVIGNNLKFTIGKTYFLCIRSCQGSINPIKISTSKSNVINKPADLLKDQPIIITNKPKTIYCKNNISTISANQIECATAYHWKVEKGAAELIFDPEQSVYLNEKDKNDIICFGPSKNNIHLKINDYQKLQLRVQGTNGVDTTKKTYFDINVDSIEKVAKTVSICNNEKYYIDNNLPGSPFLANDTCGKSTSYLVDYYENECKKNLKLTLTKICDTIIPVPDFDSKKQYCPNVLYAVPIKKYSSSFIFDWDIPNDSFDIFTKDSSIYFQFYYPGSFQIPYTITNRCKTVKNKLVVLVNSNLVHASINGNKVVFEKSTQLYCINSSADSIIWTSSKFLNWKNKIFNSQKCIDVHFDKINQSGWIFARQFNECSDIKDSIFVVVLPKKKFEITNSFENEKNVEKNEINNYIISPNPTNGSFSILIDYDIDYIDLIDLYGKKIKVFPNHHNQFEINHLPYGFYLVSIHKNGLNSSFQKLMKLE